MISYKWLEECIKQRELIDTESHKIRKAGAISGGHRTGRRNEFSPNDDRILIDHIKKQPPSAHLRGNVIYDSLAQVVCLPSPFSYGFLLIIVSTLNIRLSHGGIDGLISFRKGMMLLRKLRLLVVQLRGTFLRLGGQRLGLLGNMTILSLKQCDSLVQIRKDPSSGRDWL